AGGDKIFDPMTRDQVIRATQPQVHRDLDAGRIEAPVAIVQRGVAGNPADALPGSLTQIPCEQQLNIRMLEQASVRVAQRIHQTSDVTMWPACTHGVTQGGIEVHRRQQQAPAPAAAYRQRRQGGDSQYQTHPLRQRMRCCQGECRSTSVAHHPEASDAEPVCQLAHVAGKAVQISRGIEVRASQTRTVNGDDAEAGQPGGFVNETGLESATAVTMVINEGETAALAVLTVGKPPAVMQMNDAHFAVGSAGKPRRHPDLALRRCAIVRLAIIHYMRMHPGTCSPWNMFSFLRSCVTPSELLCGC